MSNVHHLHSHIKKFGIFNWVLTIIFALTLISLTFFSVINKKFKDVPSMLNFLNNAKVYNNLTTIIRIEVKNFIPAPLRNNILLGGLANNVIDGIITPGLVAQAAKPALELSVGFAKSPTSIIDDKVVVATAKYKQQAMSVLEGFGLPKFVIVNAQLLIDSVPKQLVLVDLKKHPNSVLGIIIKLRTLLEYNRTAMHVSWFIFTAALVTILLYNLHQVRHIFAVLFWALGIAGICIVLVNVFAPGMMTMLMPSAADALSMAQNALVSDAVSYLFTQMRSTAFLYISIAVARLLVWKFISFQKTQIKVDSMMRRLHIPRVSVKIK